MASVTKKFGGGWLNHDAWSETYLGTRRIVCDILPSSIAQQTAEDGGLCQLALVGANHLMELAIFGLINTHIRNSNRTLKINKNQYEKGSYYTALTKWVPEITGELINAEEEPILSTERLRKRRNMTIHKQSAIATVVMAKAALYSAVEGSKCLYQHFQESFRYEQLLKKYPLPETHHFSQVWMP